MQDSKQQQQDRPKAKKKFNKITTQYINRVKAGEFENWCIDEDGFINVKDKKMRTEIAALAEKIRNKPKDLFDEADYLNQEGYFKVKLITKKRFTKVYGTILIFNIVSVLTPDANDITYSEIQNESIECNKMYKTGLFQESLTYTDEDTLPDIESLLTLIEPEDECILRLSKNYRGTKFYIRYIEARGHRVGRKYEDDES